MYKCELVIEATAKEVQNYSGSDILNIAYSHMDTINLKKSNPFEIRLIVFLNQSFTNLITDNQERILKILFEDIANKIKILVSREIKPEHIEMYSVVRPNCIPKCCDPNK